MNTEEKCDKKCSRCRTYRYPKQFFNEKGRELKTCDPCREKDKISREKTRCEHGREKRFCKECGGTRICEHGRVKSRCRECGGSGFCEHGRIKSTCKECMNDEQKIEYIQKKMIKSSRESDKKKDRYDANNFIDKPFLEGLFEDSENCHYCSINFTYNERIYTFVTIERLNNNIGHTKSNCVLACFKCNFSHQDKDDIRT